MAPLPSTRRLVLEAFAARLELIQAGDEFETDAGRAVYIGVAPELGPDDPAQAIAILPADEDPRWQANKVLILWPIEVHALARASLLQPWIVVEQIVADIKRALELEDRTLGGLLLPNAFERGAVHARPRESGSLVVGAVVPYTVRVLEMWGDPT